MPHWQSEPVLDDRYERHEDAGGKESRFWKDEGEDVKRGCSESNASQRPLAHSPNANLGATGRMFDTVKLENLSEAPPMVEWSDSARRNDALWMDCSLIVSARSTARREPAPAVHRQARHPATSCRPERPCWTRLRQPDGQLETGRRNANGESRPCRAVQTELDPNERAYSPSCPPQTPRHR
jgi:hypothetical protein